MLAELLREWEQHRDLDRPSEEPILLARTSSCVVFVTDSWGPPVPYPPSHRDDGAVNYGYVRLKGSLDAVASIPEVADWPEYERFLKVINAATSPIESVGCEKGYFPVADGGEVKVELGSYTDVVFADVLLNEDPTNHLRLAAALVSALNGSEQWWSGAELGLQRLRGLIGCSRPWGLLVRVSGHGRDESEARTTWGESIKRLSESISQLPSDFPRGTIG